MKKAISLAVVAFMIALSMVSAFAASGINDAEQSILDELKAGIVLSDGTEAFVPTAYVNSAENYFNRDDVNLTAEQAAEVIKYVKEGKAVVQASDKADLNALTYAEKAKILEAGKKACKVADLTLTFDKSSKKVVITDANGTIVFEASATLIKTTGAADVDMSASIAIMASFAVIVLAAAVVAKKVRA